MIGKRVSRVLTAAVALLWFSGHAGAVSVTVDSVGLLNPNPNNISIVDAPSNTAPNGVTLAAFKTLMEGPAGAHALNQGGVLDFQQQFQGGSWPNATASNNGIDVGNGAANPVTARYGAALSSSMSFYRLPGANPLNAIDSNTNQGLNVTSGGGANNAGGTANYDFTNMVFNGPLATQVGGGYMGITNDAFLELQFNNGLAAFGITALPRGATRRSQLTFTLSDSTTFSTSNEVVGTSAVFFGGAVSPVQAALGVTITKVTFTHPDGPNRYDDLAFIAAVPEPSSLGLAGLGLLGAVATRRRLR